MFYTKMQTTLGELILIGDEKGLKRLYINNGEGKYELYIDPSWILNDIFFNDIKSQIKEYLNGSLKTFNVKLNPDGTEYQKKVWQTLTTIPFGETRSYKDIAILMGNEKASRAIGSANGKNPIPIIIPCHRVIGTNGKLTGFAFGLEVKKKMINHEILFDMK